LHYAVKNAFQMVYPIVFKEGKEIKVTIANDRLSNDRISLNARLYDFDGRVSWEKQVDTLLNANSSLVYLSVAEKELLQNALPTQSVFVVSVKTGEMVLARNFYYFTEYKKLQLENPGIHKSIKKIGEGEYEIKVTTEKLAKNVAFFTAASEGFFSDNFFDMIPGETYTLKFTGRAVNLEDDLKVMSLFDTLN